MQKVVSLTVWGSALAVTLLVFAVAAEAQPKAKYKLVNPRAAQLPTRQVLVAPNVKVDVRKFVTEGNMRRHAKTRAAFTSNFRRSFLTSAPRYEEIVESIGDRLIVTRTLNLDFKDPCDPKIPTELGVCFRPKRKGKKMKPEVAAYLRKARGKLKTLSRGKGSDAQKYKRLMTMSDGQLIEEMLNKGTTKKTITHTSVLPYTSFEFGKLPKNLNVNDRSVRIPAGIRTSAIGRNLGGRSLGRNLPAVSAAVTSQIVGTGDSGSSSQPSRRMDRSFRFDYQREHTQPLVMGWSITRTYGHTFEVEFAEETSWHDRYYARFEFGLGFGIGIRIPFEVTAKSQITRVATTRRMVSAYPATRLCPAAEGERSKAHLCAAEAEIEFSARAVPVAESNADFYRRAGMPEGDIFGGTEFLLEGGMTCSFKASIPGPDPRTWNCPASLYKSFSANFAARLSPGKVFEKRFDGRAAGLGYDLSLGYAVIDPGIRVRATKAELKFAVNRWNSVGSPRRLTLSTGKVKANIKARVGTGEQPWGLEVKNPVYRLNATISPMMYFRVGIDLGVYEWSTSFGPFVIGSMKLPALEFPAHAGTSPNFRLQVGTRKKL